MSIKGLSKIWFGMPILLPNETISSSHLANYSQSKGRATGGKLYITNRRIIFHPHILDRILFGRKLSLLLNEIDSASAEPGGKNLFNGALRDRLKVELINGSSYFFVVNGIDTLKNAIINACNIAGASDDRQA